MVEQLYTALFAATLSAAVPAFADDVACPDNAVKTTYDMRFGVNTVHASVNGGEEFLVPDALHPMFGHINYAAQITTCREGEQETLLALSGGNHHYNVVFADGVPTAGSSVVGREWNGSSFDDVSLNVQDYFTRANSRLVRRVNAADSDN